MYPFQRQSASQTQTLLSCEEKIMKINRMNIDKRSSACRIRSLPCRLKSPNYNTSAQLSRWKTAVERTQLTIRAVATVHHRARLTYLIQSARRVLSSQLSKSNVARTKMWVGAHLSKRRHRHLGLQPIVTSPCLEWSKIQKNRVAYMMRRPCVRPVMKNRRLVQRRRTRATIGSTPQQHTIIASA